VIKISELKEIKATTTTNILTPQKTLSPSSINTYYKCPRSYFYSYLAKIRMMPNIHLIKGSIVHEALEKFFNKYVENFVGSMEKCYEKAMEKNAKSIRNLELKEAELTQFTTDIKFILEEYVINFTRKIGALIHSEKAENKAHAWFLLRPKFREIYVKDDDLHCCGYIDRVTTDFDGILTIGDYKTSSKYGIGFPMDYKRQLSIYSLLYLNQEKRCPDFAGVIFLRYGEVYLLEVTPSLLRYARDTILDVYGKTRSTVFKDYPKKEGGLCRWCSYKDICSGNDDWIEKLRHQKFKEIIKKEGK